MFTIPRCSQQWQCCRAGCISGLTTAQLAIECDESPHAVPVAISLESRRIFLKKCSLGKTAKAFSFVFVILFRQRPNSTSAVQLHAGPWAHLGPTSQFAVPHIPLSCVKSPVHFSTKHFMHHFAARLGHRLHSQL